MSPETMRDNCEGVCLKNLLIWMSKGGKENVKIINDNQWWPMTNDIQW